MYIYIYIVQIYFWSRRPRIIAIPTYESSSEMHNPHKYVSLSSGIINFQRELELRYIAASNLFLR